MKAVVLHKPDLIEKNPLKVEDLPIPKPAESQVLVKVEACGVCHSNLHMIEGDWLKYGNPAKLPITPGHEIAGKVDELGEKVTDFRIGQKVGLSPLWSTCGRCEYCLRGEDNLCLHRQITGETVDGGYAEYILANVSNLFVTPDNLSPTDAASLFCPGLTSYAAVKKANLSPTNKVAIFGIGGIGHMAIQFARLYGAQVFAVSRRPHHLQVAQELGAEVIDASTTNAVEELNKRGGVHSSIISAPSNKVANQALEVTKRKGSIITVVNANLDFMFAGEHTVVGSILGTKTDMREVLNLAGAQKVKVLHEDYSLDEANRVLQKLKGGEIRARAILTP
ncbi:alcohol dehydrogenase catalytic domain-containing protein [[Eubacterium] cellulosolvens]